MLKQLHIGALLTNRRIDAVTDWKNLIILDLIKCSDPQDTSNMMKRHGAESHTSFHGSPTPPNQDQHQDDVVNVKGGDTCNHSNTCNIICYVDSTAVSANSKPERSDNIMIK